MTITPTITVNTSPGLLISTGVPGLTYEAILSSMGVFVYDVKELFYQANSINQFSNPVQYSIYDANGNIRGQQIITPVSPEQYQPTMYVKMNEVALDGQSGLNFNMLPLEQIRFIFYANRLSNEMYIDMSGVTNNFREVEKNMQLPGFFGEKNEDE